MNKWGFSFFLFLTKFTAARRRPINPYSCRLNVLFNDDERRVFDDDDARCMQLEHTARIAGHL